MTSLFLHLTICILICPCDFLTPCLAFWRAFPAQRWTGTIDFSLS